MNILRIIAAAVLLLPIVIDAGLLVQIDSPFAAPLVVLAILIHAQTFNLIRFVNSGDLPGSHGFTTGGQHVSISTPVALPTGLALVTLVCVSLILSFTHGAYFALAVNGALLAFHVWRTMKGRYTTHDGALYTLGFLGVYAPAWVSHMVTGDGDTVTLTMGEGEVTLARVE